MKSLSPALQAHLDDCTTTLSWCWRISRADGVALGFTDHDRRLSFDGTEFEPESGFAASEIRAGSDLAVDAQDASGVLSSDRITETDILDGRLDNASVELWRVNWADPSQRVLLRRGAVGQIWRGRMAFVAEVRSLAHVLGQTVGRTFQAGCDAARPRQTADRAFGLSLPHAQPRRRRGPGFEAHAGHRVRHCHVEPRPCRVRGGRPAVGFLGFGYYPRSGFMHIDLGPARSRGEPFPARATPFVPEVTPAREALADSRTLKGGGAASVATVGAAGVEVAQEVLAETQSAILPLVPYLDTLRWGFIAVALIGIVVAIHARVDDWKRGQR